MFSFANLAPFGKNLTSNAGVKKSGVCRQKETDRAILRKNKIVYWKQEAREQGSSINKMSSCEDEAQPAVTAINAIDHNIFRIEFSFLLKRPPFQPLQYFMKFSPATSYVTSYSIPEHIKVRNR